MACRLMRIFVHLRWESEALCRETIMSFVAEADVLKLTDEELFFLTETTTLEDGFPN